jgi:hypothetical protein
VGITSSAVHRFASAKLVSPSRISDPEPYILACDTVSMQTDRRTTSNRDGVTLSAARHGTCRRVQNARLDLGYGYVKCPLATFLGAAPRRHSEPTSLAYPGCGGHQPCPRNESPGHCPPNQHSGFQSGGIHAMVTLCARLMRTPAGTPGCTRAAAAAARLCSPRAQCAGLRPQRRPHEAAAAEEVAVRGSRGGGSSCWLLLLGRRPAPAGCDRIRRMVQCLECPALTELLCVCVTEL